MGKHPPSKPDILRRLIGDVGRTLRELEGSYATARQAVLDSPHVMKSKREVAGIEASYLADGLAQTIRERAGWLRALAATPLPEQPERVGLGCLVGLGRPAGPPETLYFLLPAGGGLELPGEDGAPPVRVLTPGTALARALLGRGLGDPVAIDPGSPAPREIRLLL